MENIVQKVLEKMGKVRKLELAIAMRKPFDVTMQKR